MEPASDRARIDENGAAVRVTRLLLADVDTTWETVTDAALRSEWDDGQLDPVPAGEDNEPGRRWRCRRADSESGTLIEVSEMTAGTRLRVVESGFLDSEPHPRGRRRASNDAVAYWDAALDRLAAVLEKQDSQ